MESTLFTTLTATEEASLSGGNKPVWKKHKPPAKPPAPVVPKPSTPTPTTTTTTTTTTTNVGIIVAPVITVIAGSPTAVVVYGPKINQKVG
ncbi:hypothetical protein [Nostoc sp.]|uniref:hypothetical protein n=1 Tax=Nostoc sp. TaxID=1180 RepID=UPI002FF46699